MFYQVELAGGEVDQLQPPIGALSTIEATVHLQIQQVVSDTGHTGGNYIGEAEVDESDDSGDDKAQNDGIDDEFWDNGIFFEP